MSDTRTASERFYYRAPLAKALREKLKKKKRPPAKDGPSPTSPIMLHLLSEIDRRKLQTAVIARNMGITAQAFWYWKRRHRSPTINHVEALAKELGYKLVLEKI